MGQDGWCGCAVGGLRHPWHLALLISTFVPLQRGICVTFMCGFSAGYDVVAIAPSRQPPSQPPIIVGGCCFVSLLRQKKKCQLFFGREWGVLLTRLTGELFTVGRPNKWACRNPISRATLPSWTSIFLAPRDINLYIQPPAACRQFKLIIIASANIVVIIQTPLGLGCDSWQIAFRDFHLFWDDSGVALI